MIEVNPAIRPDETLDAFYKGKILVLQRKNGFRFSIDAPSWPALSRLRMRTRFLKLELAVE